MAGVRPGWRAHGCASCLQLPPLPGFHLSLWACPDPRPDSRCLASSGASLGPRIAHGAEPWAGKQQELVGECLVLPCTCSAASWWGRGTERSHAGLGPRALPCRGAHWGWREPRGSKGAKKAELGDLEGLEAGPRHKWGN